ncbi:MAG: methyl-accepting chemotaxis protein [Planctomycetota bacterium]
MISHSTQPTQLQSGLSIGRKLLITLVAGGAIPATVLLGALIAGTFLVPAAIVAIVLMASAAGLNWFLMNGVARQANVLNETLFEINRGNPDSRATALTRDELGQAALELNRMCDDALNLSLSSDQNKKIQGSIKQLISEVEQIAAGDLTITTQVNRDLTGSIAASVNRMTSELRSIVERVQTAAEQVNYSSTHIREASTRMSRESDDQAERIVEASTELMEMTDSFQTVADLTNESMQVAVEARQTAANGLKAVSDTVEGMQRIRSQVQTTSKRIKRLGESSQEIGEIVQLISDITDRTSILALNASIQAAMAGDAGQGFAVVAEEIEHLAESSKDATKRISKLIRAIQSETGEVISDMEESTREVVSGSQLASQAGEKLFEINSVSNQLVELIQTSSTHARQQADTATKVAGSMSEISQATKHSAERSRQSTLAVGQLADMVARLRDSVTQFKVNDKATSHSGGGDGPVIRDFTVENESDEIHLALLNELREASAEIERASRTAKADSEKTDREETSSVSH